MLRLLLSIFCKSLYQRTKYLTDTETFPKLRIQVSSANLQDGDGKISLAEYIGDMYHQDDAEEDGGHEPEWVTAEKEQFTKHRDQNNDGFMDMDEVR